MTWLLGIHPAYFLTSRALLSNLKDKDKEDSERLVMSPNPTFFLGLGELERRGRTSGTKGVAFRVGSGPHISPASSAGPAGPWDRVSHADND